ncbi:uncharacterized protein VP01_3336g1 [Puccinia sorghi]|uniref:Uncharacterized protein n=1 Tax=Puccinia sorghi TaxID=27349 RepID=A0A0L6UZ23_9BASI|nr:uncharacterized protein VP01_3336g1 [Puccinia sorghi]
MPCKRLADFMDLEDTPETCLPEQPLVNPPVLVFLAFLAGIIGNPKNQLEDGVIKLDQKSLGIQRMMEAEATCLSQLEKLLESHEAKLPTIRFQILRNTGPVTGPAPPSVIPPPREALRSLEPGKAIIHSRSACK